MTDASDTVIRTQDLAALAHDVKQFLLFQKSLGCTGFDCSEDSLQRLSQWGKPRARKKPVDPVTAPADSAAPTESFERIRTDLGDCRRCPLGSRRINLVFGQGNPNARLMFIGEAPGFEEDKQGQPFVGASGQLLVRMIEAMTLTRDQVYITNILKCRPTENRNPLPEEINACFPFLIRQIESVKPEVICTLGAFATQALLGKHDGVSRLRGRFHDYRSFKVMPTFHPAYLLRNPASKREAWGDLQKIMTLLGLERKK
jgi:uracil-DNA glycosylase